MKDEFAITIARCGFAAGLVLSVLRLVGLTDIGWLSIAGVAFGPAALGATVGALYIVYRVKLRK
jgi:hypothetical protein